MTMSDKFPQKALKYVLDETYFYQQERASINIQGSLGFGTPAASFAIYGDLALDGNQKVTINVYAKELIFPLYVRPDSVIWHVDVMLSKNGQQLSKQRVRQHHRHYLRAPSRDYLIGEAYFDLPEITERNHVVFV